MKGALFDYWQRETSYLFSEKNEKKGLFQILIKEKFQALYFTNKNVT